jgi:hypothetical protein
VESALMLVTCQWLRRDTGYRRFLSQYRLQRSHRRPRPLRLHAAPHGIFFYPFYQSAFAEVFKFHPCSYFSLAQDFLKPSLWKIKRFRKGKRSGSFEKRFGETN